MVPGPSPVAGKLPLWGCWAKPSWQVAANRGFVQVAHRTQAVGHYLAAVRTAVEVCRMAADRRAMELDTGTAPDIELEPGTATERGTGAADRIEAVAWTVAWTVALTAVTTRLAPMAVEGRIAVGRIVSAVAERTGECLGECLGTAARAAVGERSSGMVHRKRAA